MVRKNWVKCADCGVLFGDSAVFAALVRKIGRKCADRGAATGKAASVASVSRVGELVR